jgi:hypothetical protein
MKKYRLIPFSALIISFAMFSSTMSAQSAPVAALPPADASASRSSSLVSEPNPLLAYVRPSDHEKFRQYRFDAFGPYAFAKAIAAGGFQQASGAPPEWGGGMKSFGVRVASDFGIQLVTTTARYAMAHALHEDAAYYRCNCTGFVHRVRHALVSTVTARHGEDGRTRFSISGLAAPYVGTMTALAWYPERYGYKDAFRMGNYNLAGQAAGNLALEFIYGGPHTMFSNMRHSKSQGGTQPDPNP